jgi:hypothetical protein
MKLILILLATLALSGCIFSRSTEPMKVNDMTAEVPTATIHF